MDAEIISGLSKLHRNDPKETRTSTALAGISVALAGAATLWLIFWPYSYSGISLSSNGDESVKTSASLIMVNGYRVVLVLLVPCALTVIGFLAIRSADSSHVLEKVAIWLPAIVLLLFCVVALFSVGLFYIPSAVALFCNRSGRRALRKASSPAP